MLKNSLNVIILSIALVISAFLFSNAFQNRNKSNDTISVTGLGKTDFVSDLIVWTGSFSKKSSTLKDAYASLDADREKIKSYLSAKGIPSTDIVFSAISFNKDFETTYNENGTIRQSIFTGFTLNQIVTIQSKDVNKIEDISRQSSELINTGVEFYSNAPEYYYTKLAELKIKMIAEATKDASNRAKSIAENADAGLGNLKKSDMGVFQIIAQNSSEDYSYGGSFNTNSKNKTATITIKLVYQVD
ncbi:SIMPL domain-containing protein [Flavobacterium sp. XN-5]|uniref:SIMPL domain-containing protein n=1 Tax=Flavobacterium hiemivividum TaxID=2541734 RepID=A0A4R5CQZ5_9FLAO|nr:MULTISPECIES: SIMPL domain-containing protein [Flavobacterium]NGY38565.1 SIMPL domain-containing protein [Flavobacterium sp. XN-5]TDE02949.1 SIMPL domain-containing protein [Flavobacterium hiemivividum]